MRAVWNDRVVARSDDIVTVEGNAYFPRQALDPEVVIASDHTSVCPRKGTAHYLSLEVAGQTNLNAGWFYPEPKQAAAEIKDRVAFWKAVLVTA